MSCGKETGNSLALDSIVPAYIKHRVIIMPAIVSAPEVDINSWILLRKRLIKLISS